MKLIPQELMERLAALVLEPKVRSMRYYGFLALHPKFKKQIIPKPPELRLVG